MYACQICHKSYNPEVKPAYIAVSADWTVKPVHVVRFEPVCVDCASEFSIKQRIPVCERRGCTDLSCGKSIYGLGYLATVCQVHYDTATQNDRDNAIHFRYAE